MNFLPTGYTPDREEGSPLLLSRTDETSMQADADYDGRSSRESSPTLSFDADRKHSSQLTVNLELGPPTPQRPSTPGPPTELDHQISAAAKELSRRQEAHSDQALLCHKVIRQIDRLGRQYSEEVRKAPIYPPKGTWFHHERKQFAQKKADHDMKLRSIARLRKAAIERDWPLAESASRRAAEAVAGARATLEDLRRRKGLAEAQQGAGAGRNEIK